MNIKILTLTLFSFFTFSTMAQEAKPKVKEVGITFYNLKNYGAIFKIGQEDRLWRFRVLSSSANKTDYGNQHLTNFTYHLPITTRWMDNDMYGHINNVHYYSYFDTVVNA